MYVAVFSYVGLIIFKIHHDSLIAHLHHYIIDAIESTDNLADLQHWLRLISDKRATIFFALPFAFLLPLPGLYVLWTLPENFVGPGLIIQTVLSEMPVGMGVYIVILFFNIPIRLSHYQFRLYSADPVSSELVHQLSGMFTVSMYLFATLAAVATIVTAIFAIGRLPSIVFLRFIALWAVMAYLFAITQYCLSKIITLAKYRTLSELQAQLKQLWTDAKIGDKETRETLNWLMDYHDRIKATRNSALDLRAILNFVNSLLLPLVAFVLANLETIRALFR